VLGQHHDGPRTRTFDQGQIAFDARRVEVVVETGQHQHHVYVAGDDLAGIAFARGRALEHTAARQHFHDVRRRAGLDDHEIADRGTFAWIEVALEEFRRGLRVERALAVVDFVTGAVLGRNPRQHLVVREWREIALPADAPQRRRRLRGSGCHGGDRRKGGSMWCLRTP